MKFDKKLVPVFSAIILLTLSIGAYAYAHWQEDLYFDGEFYTGTFEAEFKSPIPNTDGLDEVVTQWDANYLVAPLAWELVTDKNIASAWLEISQDGKTLTMHVSNAYPGLMTVWDVEVYNTGSVPWRLWYAELLGIGWFNQGLIWLPINLDGDADIEAYMTFDTDAFGLQKDPGYHADLSWKIYFTNHVKEGECFDLDIWLWYLNWNEWPKLVPSALPEIVP